jgi:hypothetical protein
MTYKMTPQLQTSTSGPAYNLFCSLLSYREYEKKSDMIVRLTFQKLPQATLSQVQEKKMKMISFFRKKKKDNVIQCITYSSIIWTSTTGF